MSCFVDLRNVSLDYNIYSVRAQSLRNALVNMTVGGVLMRNSRDLTVVRALSNISFRLEEGDRLALLGHNGSGKTTLLKVIAGIYEPTTGTVDVSGRMSSTIDLGHGLDPEASGRQNIRNLGLMRRLTMAQINSRLAAIAEFSGLEAYLEFPLKTYSAGMTARLMFSTATEFPSDVLVLDEWLGAGDAAFVKKAIDRMNALVAAAKIVVLATHDTGLARSVCNKLCVLDAGKIVYLGPPAGWAP